MDDVQTVTPDVVSEDVLESIDHGERDLAAEADELEICTECMDELRGD